jgi:hypothetical protein
MKQIFKNCFALFALFWSFSSFSQGLKLYKKGPLAPDTAIREFTKNITLADGSNVFVGQADEGPVVEFSLTKTDAEGTILWQKVIQHDGVDAVNNFCQTADGGFAMVGWTDGASGTDIDGIVIKVNPTGDIEWSKRISTNDDDEAFGVATMDNGDIIVAGASFVGINRNGFAVRITQVGTEVWTKSYRQANFNAFRSVLPMPNNGAMLCGYSWKLGAGSTLFDPFFVNIDNLGNIIWAKKKKQAGSQVLYDFKKDNDGGILYSGVSTVSGVNENVLGKVTATGDHVWAKTFGTPNGDRIWDMAVMGSGEIIVAGFTDKNNTANSRRNGFISKLENSGTVIQTVAFGTTDTSSTTFTGVSLNGNFLVANALTYGFGNPFGAILVAKLSTFSLLQNCQGATLTLNSANLATTDSTGGETLDGPLVSEETGITIGDNDLVMESVCTFVSTEDILSADKILVFPNPTNGKFTLQNLGIGNKSIRVFSAQGKLMFTSESIEDDQNIDLENEVPGLFHLQVISEKGKFATTLLKN